MPKDRLFLLPPAFPDPAVGPGLFHCIECARLEGLFTYTPGLRQRLDVEQIPHPGPRAALIALLGEPHQNCPTLVIAASSPAAPELLKRSSITGRWYCTGDQYLLKAHIDYLLMTGLLMIFFLLFTHFGVSPSLLVVISMSGGSVLNPLGFLALAIKPDLRQTPSSPFGLVMAVSFTLTTIGYAGAAWAVGWAALGTL
jgi:hypothetical protein